MCQLVIVGLHGLLVPLIPAHGQEASAVLDEKLTALRMREKDCLQRAASVTQQRREATFKPYVTEEARVADWSRLETALQDQRQCLIQTNEALTRSLAALEIGCQRIVDSRAPGAAAEVHDAARCVEGARGERLNRERLAGFRAQQFACDQEGASIDRFARKEVASPNYTQGTSRTYRDQSSDLRMFEQARAQKEACASNAAVQIAILQQALGLSNSATAGSGEPPSRLILED
jgi:hypothetical protein